MATFYYNPYSGESRSAQWLHHIQTQAYVGDIGEVVASSASGQTRLLSSIVDRQTKAIAAQIQGASRSQIESFQAGTEAICGKLTSGFSLMSDHLHDISYDIKDLHSEVSAMAAMLDWKLSLLVEQQRLSNLLMGNIAQLLRIPDIQKERQYYIEQGVKFLKNATLDQAFYEDALRNLRKAVSIEPTDFFALHRLGLVHMYSTEHLDLEVAEDYFRRAAKYAMAEAGVGGSAIQAALVGDVGKNLLDQLPTAKTLTLQAAESYLFAARACYIQGNLSGAADLAGKGFCLAPALLEAGFTQAKALAALNRDSEAITVLEAVIRTDRFYSLKVLSDLDLCPRHSTQDLLQRLRIEATAQAADGFGACKPWRIPNSAATSYLEDIERLLGEDAYLPARRALDLLDSVRTWAYCAPFSNAHQAHHLHDLVDIVRALASFRFAVSDESLAALVHRLGRESQWCFPTVDAIRRADPDWVGSIRSSTAACTVAEFVRGEWEFDGRLPHLLAEYRALMDKHRVENSQREEAARLSAAMQNASNFTASIGAATVGGLGGALGGLACGFVIGLVVFTVSCFSSPNPLRYSGDNVNHGINLFVLALTLIGGLLGGIIGYKMVRN